MIQPACTNRTTIKPRRRRPIQLRPVLTRRTGVQLAVLPRLLAKRLLRIIPIERALLALRLHLCGTRGAAFPQEEECKSADGRNGCDADARADTRNRACR
jgi:hypothetical protein